MSSSFTTGRNRFNEELEALADDFLSVAGAEILTPRAVERQRGGNSGFSHFSRAVSVPDVPDAPAPRKCRRCRQIVFDGRVLCLRHREQARIWATERMRRRGVKPWNGRGRPPNAVRAFAAAEMKASAELALQESLLVDALSELAAMEKRVARLRAEVTVARKAVQRASFQGRRGSSPRWR